MALPTEKRYTYADLLSWDEDVRAELVDGVPVLMAPPSPAHQRAAAQLTRQFTTYLLGKRCEAFPAPFGVYLFADEKDRPEDIDTMVEPDLCVICDPNKLDEHGYKGVPALVIEILSPSNFQHDRIIKHSLYQRAGVQEYWIVDPIKQVVLVHTLNDGQYCPPVIYTKEQPVPVGVLEGCEIDLRSVFPE